MFDKGQSLWDSRQNFEKNKGQDLALSHNVRDIFSRSTGAGKIVVPRFGEFCFCCCLPLLPQLACSIPATWEQPYRDSLYAVYCYYF